jgi:hypothetical protein
MVGEEADGVGSSCGGNFSRREALRKTCPFLNCTGFPEGSVGGVEDLSVLRLVTSIAVQGICCDKEAWGGAESASTGAGTLRIGAMLRLVVTGGSVAGMAGTTVLDVRMSHRS